MRKRAKRKLGSRECRRGRIAAQGRGSASEEERAALSLALTVVYGLAFERGDRLARERKGGLDVRVRHLVDFVLGDLQKGLPYAETCVVERCADVGCRPVCAHGAEGGLDLFVAVLGYRKRGCLCWLLLNDDLIRGRDVVGQGKRKGMGGGVRLYPLT